MNIQIRLSFSQKSLQKQAWIWCPSKLILRQIRGHLFRYPNKYVQKMAISFDCKESSLDNLALRIYEIFYLSLVRKDYFLSYFPKNK